MHWLRDIGGTMTGYCQSVLVRSPAQLTESGLLDVLQTVLDQHDVLRMRLTAAGPDSDWRLDISAPGTVSAASILTTVPVGPDRTEADLRPIVTEQVALARGRLAPADRIVLQAVWFDAGSGHGGRLLLVAHHLAVDAASWRILLPDLAAAWAAVSAGGRPALAPVTMSFRAWSALLTEQAGHDARIAEFGLWHRMLADSAPSIGIRALDPARDTVRTARSVNQAVPTDLTRDLLTRVPATLRLGVDEALLTALAIAVASGRSGGGVRLGVESHGRPALAGHVDLSRTVGWFTSLFPLRLDLGEVDWTDLWARGRLSAASSSGSRSSCGRSPTTASVSGCCAT